MPESERKIFPDDFGMQRSVFLGLSRIHLQENRHELEKKDRTIIILLNEILNKLYKYVYKGVHTY